MHRPAGALAGFHTDAVDPAVPELLHAGEQWRPTHYRIGGHRHDGWEFYLQVHGRTLWGAAGREHALTPGGFYAAPPGIDHALLNRPTGKHHFLYVGVDVAAALKRQPALTPCFSAREFIAMSAGEAVEAPLRALIHEIATDAPFRALGLRAALDHLLIACARLLTRAGERALVPAHPGTARTRHLIDRRPDERWTIAALAREAGLSPSRLCELFVRDVGMPPRQYLLHRRISRAKESLRDTDIAITVLALDLGFSSSQHFARTFRRLVGCTAFAFRRRYRS